MKLLYNKIFLSHDTGQHPECIERLNSFNNLPDTPLDYRLELVELVHSLEYINKVKEYSAVSRPLDGDTLTSPKSFETAVYGASAAVLAAETGNFALSRPPGHHAYRNRGSGFCLFNNIAIAAQHLVNQGKKVFIFDFDGHYGDGTADIFYESDQVLYCSIHQFPAFPGNGDKDEIGRGKGLGYTLNIPVPPQAGDDILLDAFKAILPIVKKFNPDVVGVSAGFDGHIYDPLLQLRYSLDGFHKIGKLLSSNFKQLFAILEGGYDTEILPKAIQNFIDGVNHKRPSHKEFHTDSEIMVWNTYELSLDELLTKIKSLWDI
ncbi:MAG: histone deacetylase [Cyclobacteriaceae bacterium]|nr:histone deacetylase [Cyclobacteriaceae bacterium]